MEKKQLVFFTEYIPGRDLKCKQCALRSLSHDQVDARQLSLHVGIRYDNLRGEERRGEGRGREESEGGGSRGEGRGEGEGRGGDEKMS